MVAILVQVFLYGTWISADYMLRDNYLFYYSSNVLSLSGTRSYGDTLTFVEIFSRVTRCFVQRIIF